MRPYLFFILRWITPLLLSMVGPVVSSNAAASVIEGQWTFVDDGTVIDVTACPTRDESLCAVIVRLPSSAQDVTPGERTLLCRTHLLGDLKSQGARNVSKPTYRGWIIDPEDLLKGGSPTRYDATLTVTSPTRAVIEVRIVDGLYPERHALIRNALPVRSCGVR